MSNEKSITPIEEVRGTLQKLSGEFRKALPAHIPVERFIRVVQTAITTNPDLMTADRASLWAACTRSASAALIPDGKEAALVTFKEKSGTKKVTFMPMIGGILKLIRNSGELASLSSQIIHKNDEFSYYVDESGEHIMHRPNLFGERGERIGVYALATTKDGASYIEVMTTKQVNDVKNVSRSKDYGPWSGPFEEEMWKKTSLRRLSKRLPMSTDIEDIIRKDDDLFMPPKDVTPAEEKNVELPAPKKKAPRRTKLQDAINIKDDTPTEEELLQEEEI